jgi:large subunit ribosomal protein L23
MSPLFGKKTVKKEEKKNPVVANEAVESKSSISDAESKVMNIDTYLQPYITEKSNSLAADNKYVFLVLKRANKIIVKQLVEKTYKVKVADVNMIFLSVSPKRLGARQALTRKGGYKKAIVTLKPGYKIDLAI